MNRIYEDIKYAIGYEELSDEDKEKNDLFINGNKGDIPGIKSFIQEISSITNFHVLDERISKDDGIKLLENSDVIYLLGGNPITQIQYILENGYNEVMLNFDGIILGTSAGAMNLSKKCYYSKDEDYNESFFYEGLGLVNITIDPHFDLDDNNQVNEVLNNSRDIKIIGIPNESAIKIINNKVEFINRCFMIQNNNIKDMIGVEDV